MRIDAHQHFWDLERFPYPWMPADPSPLRRTFLPADLQPILERNNFDGTVVVQATTLDGEADWLLQLAAENPFILGVVAWVDLADPHVGQRLDELQTHRKFRGVRHPVHDESDNEWLLRTDILRGLKELQRRAIPYDLLLRPQHLPIVPRVIDQVPDLRMVIDHLAKPMIAQQVFEPWAADMERLARYPQMYVKVSGMITEADWDNWLPEHLRPYVQHVWKVFGADRCMFGSDWPVCLSAGSWKEVLAAFTQSMGPVDKELRSRAMGQTAVDFYDLPEASFKSA